MLSDILLESDGKADYYTADVRSYSNYYAFGMQQPGRQFVSAFGSHRYGFNGKERDTEWNKGAIYDYGFRIYDPRIVRFLSVDPLASSYPFYSPYQFAGNNFDVCFLTFCLKAMAKRIIIQRM